MATKTKTLWDVVIFDITTRIVASIVGKKLSRSEGFQNAEKRLETALTRINDRYDAAIVPAGEFAVGDVLP